jgi:hypothetical protein
MYSVLGLIMLASAFGLLWTARPIEGLPRRWITVPYMQEIIVLTITALCAAGVTLLVLGMGSLVK